MSSGKRTALISVALLMLLASAAFSAQEGNVMMAGFLLFKVRCPAQGQSIAQRADAIQARANDLLVIGGIDMSSVKLERLGSDVAIYAGGRLLATVTWCDARANDTTPWSLANTWADRFKHIYPMVVPKPPKGETNPPR